MKSPNFKFHLCRNIKLLHRFIFISLLIFTNTFIYSQQPAFPTANGGGSNASGGRGQSVYHVTNLNDSGAGSFRDAVSQGNRTIVFDVSGTILLDTNLYIDASNITIAGQTAPAGGITICGQNLSFDGADNLIIRYIRIRLNLDDHSWGGTDAVRFANSDNVILDHCSVSWGTDETVTFWQSSNNITIQNCIIGEGKTGSIFGDSDNAAINSNLSYLRNAIYNTTHRTPNVNSNSRVDILNNVVFNWKYRLSRVSGNIQLNHIGNYYSMGSLNSVSSIGHQLYTSVPNNSVYTAENILDDEGTILMSKTDNQWDPIWQEWREGQETITANTAQQRGTKHPDMINPPTIIDTDVLVPTLMDDVGANKSLNEDGSFTEGLDNVDAVYRANILAGDAISYTSYSGGQDYNTTAHWSDFWASVSNTPINTRSSDYDTDNDGMADLWETNTFGDLTKDGTGDSDGDGYTDLEEFLNLVDGEPVIIPAENVTVSPDAATINIPETIQLTQTFTPENTSNQTGVWSSNNTAVATVSNSGLVTPVSEGEAIITFTANDGGFSDSSTITVTNIVIPLESLNITPDTATLDLNESLQLNVEFFPSNTTNTSGIWSSSDESIVVVDDNGLITTLSEGQASITFTADDSGITDSVIITVEDVFFGIYEFYNADTDVMIQEINDDITFDLNIIGNQINFRSIPQNGDTNADVESVRVEWNGIEIGEWTESEPIYAGMTNHTDFDFAPYTALEGTYNFVVSYYSGNSATGNVVATDSFKITFTMGFSIDAGEDQVICSGSNDEIILTATEATSYLWSTGETTQSISVQPSETTIYTVTGIDSGGNEATDSVTVTVNPSPTANAGQDQIICQDESITLTASGGDTYEWSSGQTTQSITVSPQETTNYSVTVTSGGCSATDDVLVIVNPTPSINAGDDITIYENESTTLTAIGDGTFVWSTGEETQSITVSPTETTTYTVTATIDGCSNSDTVTVTVLTLTANAGEDSTICEGESVTLTASGGPNYLWSTGETTQSIVVSPTETTIYTVTVFNDFTSATDDVEVAVNATPVAAVSNDQTILFGESIPLTASGGSQFLWSTGETTSEIIVSPTDTTTYTVEVFENGCSDIATVTVTVNVSASVAGEQTICQGETTTLYASGGSYFEWSTGENTQSIVVNPTQTTTYTVIVSNNSSSDEAEITVNVNLVPIADAGEDVTIEAGQNVILTASGGNTYLWSTGETSQSISVTPEDTTLYTLETFVNGCSNTDDVLVTVVPQVNASAGEDVEICLGEATTLTASGGSTYLWSNGESTQSIIVSPGETTIYTVEVSNGFSTQSAEVMVGVLDCQTINNEPEESGFEFNLYPNPTVNNANVKLEGLDEVSSIFISDLKGQIISSEIVEPVDGQVITKQYDLSGLTKGIYLITLKQTGKPALTKKLILN